MWRINGFGIFMSCVNAVLILYLWGRDWLLCRLWPIRVGADCAPYNTASEQMLTLHLGLLQATLVAIAVGLALMGVFGFRTIQDAAVKSAHKAVTEYLDNTEIQVEQRIVSVVPPTSERTRMTPEA